jgi:hypothetical protein
MRVQSWVSYLVQHARAAEAPTPQHQDEECQEASQPRSLQYKLIMTSFELLTTSLSATG